MKILKVMISNNSNQKINFNEENKDHLHSENLVYKQLISEQDFKLNQHISHNQTLQYNLNQMQDYCNNLVAELNLLKNKQYEMTNFKDYNLLEQSNKELMEKCHYLEKMYFIFCL